MKQEVYIVNREVFSGLKFRFGGLLWALHLLLLILVFSACQKPERNNPWDEKNARNPQEWSPNNLQISTLSPVIRKLSWDYGTHHIEGFKIDRKKGEEPWQTTYAILPKTTLEWIDEQIVPDPALVYQYRVYAFAGGNISGKTAISDSAAIPTPDNLQIATHSTTSITLSWNYNFTGHDGFMIDRKAGDEPWVTGFATLNPDQTSFHDNTVNLESKSYSFKVYSFYEKYHSPKTEVAQQLIHIGSISFGGIVFYFNGSGGGMVCTQSNQSMDAEWGCYEAWAGSFGTAIGTGAGNTAMIVANCSQSGIAARICSALVLNGYSDWFLPSKDELNLMYQNLNQAGLGAFANDWYWSSTENNSSNAWLQNFSDGGQVSGSKGTNKYVRAVRVF